MRQSGQTPLESSLVGHSRSHCSHVSRSSSSSSARTSASSAPGPYMSSRFIGSGYAIGSSPCRLDVIGYSFRQAALSGFVVVGNDAVRAKAAVCVKVFGRPEVVTLGAARHLTRFGFIGQGFVGRLRRGVTRQDRAEQTALEVVVGRVSKNFDLLNRAVGHWFTLLLVVG